MVREGLSRLKRTFSVRATSSGYEAQALSVFTSPADRIEHTLESLARERVASVVVMNHRQSAVGMRINTSTCLRSTTQSEPITFKGTDELTNRKISQQINETGGK